MVYLIEAEDVKIRYGIPKMPSTDATVLSAMRAAHLRIASYLDSPLDRETRTEHFKLNTVTNPVVVDGYYRLRLRAGFVREEPEVRSAESFAGGFSPVPAEHLRYDLIKGIVYVSEDYADCVVEVTYDAGYDQGDSCPEWLEEALIGYVGNVIEFSSPGEGKEKGGGGKKQEEAEEHALGVLDPYTRKIGFAIHPMF